MIDASTEIKGYRIDTDERTRHMRIVFFKDEAHTLPVGFAVLSSTEGYDFASAILKKYDILEGISDHA